MLLVSLFFVCGIAQSSRDAQLQILTSAEALQQSIETMDSQETSIIYEGPLAVTAPVYVDNVDLAPVEDIFDETSKRAAAGGDDYHHFTARDTVFYDNTQSPSLIAAFLPPLLSAVPLGSGRARGRMILEYIPTSNGGANRLVNQISIRAASPNLFLATPIIVAVRIWASNGPPLGSFTQGWL